MIVGVIIIINIQNLKKMKKVKNKIKRVIGSIKNTRIQYSKKGLIVPIYHGYDSQGKLIFDVKSMREEFESILNEFEFVD